MASMVKIMARIIYEDNKLSVRLKKLSEVGVEIEGLGNNLIEIIMDILDVPTDWRENGTEKYYNFFRESRTYAECEAFLTEWKAILDEEKLGSRGKGPR